MIIKCVAISNFSLKEFDKIKILERASISNSEDGKLYLGDIFESDYEMANYLLGNNKDKNVVIKVIEVIPEKKEKKTNKK